MNTQHPPYLSHAAVNADAALHSAMAAVNGAERQRDMALEGGDAALISLSIEILDAATKAVAMARPCHTAKRVCRTT